MEEVVMELTKKEPPRRTGKTYSALSGMVGAALLGKVVSFAAVDRQAIRHCISMVREILKNNGHAADISIDHTSHRVLFPGGGRLDFFVYDDNYRTKLRGTRYFYSEIDHFAEEVYGGDK
jgi:hypothetical protein